MTVSVGVVDTAGGNGVRSISQPRRTRSQWPGPGRGTFNLAHALWIAATETPHVPAKLVMGVRHTSA
jgi:hypothetical protein